MPMILTATAMLILVADPSLADNTPPVVPYNSGYDGGDYSNKGYGGGDYYKKGYGSSTYGSNAQPGYDVQPPTSGQHGPPSPASPSVLTPQSPWQH